MTVTAVRSKGELVKILLVNLERRGRLFRAPFWAPVTLPSAAAFLRRGGHEVKIVEPAAMDGRRHDQASAFAGRIRRLSPAMIVFDVRAEYLSDFGDMARIARRAAPSALLVAIGRHPTLLPGDLLETVDVLDAAVTGEPELPLLEMAGGGRPGSVASTAGRRGDGVLLAPGGPALEDLDELPLPAWDLLDMAYYARSTPRVIPCLMLRTGTVETSRGCRGGCLFCAEGRFNARPVRAHSPGWVADAVELLVRHHRVNGVYFSDEMFLDDHERVAGLCQEFRRRDLHRTVQWSAQVRADAVEPGILREMKAAGCVQLEFGIESGSGEVLDALCKGSTVETNRSALTMAAEAGIRSLAYIMYALPGERLRDAELTESFLESARPDIVRPVRYVAIPGAPLTGRLIAEKCLEPLFWRHQTRRGDPFGGPPPNLTLMDDSELQRVSRRLYFRHTFPRLVRDVLRHDPMGTVMALRFGVLAGRLGGRALGGS